MPASSDPPRMSCIEDAWLTDPNTTLMHTITIQNTLFSFSFRSGNITQARKREDPGFYPISESSRPEGGVLRRSLHSEAVLWFWWNYCVKWQLQGLAKWETGVEEVHRRAPPNVLVCQRQVRNNDSLLWLPKYLELYHQSRFLVNIVIYSETICVYLVVTFWPLQIKEHAGNNRADILWMTLVK